MTSPLREAVAAAFGFSGALAKADEQYVEREAQLRMALAVADAIDERRALVAEAGTGVGKTFAYLVPVLLSGARAMVSTATKSLQDQLFLRDLPWLLRTFRLPLTVALLKGRGSYLCLHRMNQARQMSEVSNLPDRWAARTLGKIEVWSQSTLSGDLAELEGLDERSSVIPLVTSTRENCLGAECPEFRQCHVLKARRDAMAADLVVVNHHLFFADMALRDTGVAELLPSVDVAVFDEAHQLGEAGVQFLGATLSSAQVIDFARDTLACGLQLARGLAPWQEAASGCERAARDLRLACSGPLREVKGVVKLRWDDRCEFEGFVAALAHLRIVMESAISHIDTVSEIAPDFQRLLERGRSLVRLAEQFSAPADSGSVRWLDLTAQQVRLVESPLDIRDALHEQMSAHPKAWIFTSATLGDDDALTWFTEPSGLTGAPTVRVGSPFDYARNARLYVPRHFPKPSEPTHLAAVAALAASFVRQLGGRTFVLTTTLRALQIVGDSLREALGSDTTAVRVLMQGQMPKRQLLQEFLDSPRAVLVGSQSFWEGIDVPGDALQCVLIDKLPFPPPNDPLVEARVKRLEGQGRNAFADHFLAEAAVSLKQGAGRLIRRETDRGLLVVCDPRMAVMGYGRRLRAALPPIPVLVSEEEAMTWLAQLAQENAERG